MEIKELIKLAKKNEDIKKYNNDILLKVLTKNEYYAFLFLNLNHGKALSKFLKSNISYIQALINNPEYNTFQIPKKKGGFREIQAPDTKLKNIQKNLSFFLQSYYLLIKPHCVHGFFSNLRNYSYSNNIVSNALPHTAKKYVLNIDLKDFFTNISARMLLKMFMSELFQFPENLATGLTLLTTFKGFLPTGAPTSPILSNFICMQMDIELEKFCALNNINYTRYADDLTFSMNEKFNDEMLDIISIINRNGFFINEKKLRILSKFRKQVVTGIVVNEKVNVDRKYIKKVRAMLHDLKVNGLEAAAKNHFKCLENPSEKITNRFLFRLSGYIDFIGNVRSKNDFLYIKYKNELTHFHNEKLLSDLL